MPHSSFRMVLLAVVLLGNAHIFGQSLERRFLIGFGAGTQKLVTNAPGSQFGVGGEGILGYRFTDRIGVTGSGGYATFPFNVGASFNVYYGNVLFDVELANQSSFHPYLALGGGGVNFPSGPNRFNDVTAVGGAGFRVLLQPNLALNVNGLYNRYVSGTLKNNAYVSARAGLTFVLGGGGGSSDEDMFVEEAPFEEVDSPFENRRRESQGLAGQAGSMQDYVRLKSQVDEINQDIDNKEREISSLVSAVNESKQQVTDMQAAAPAGRMEANAGFSRAYEQALNNFYSKRYAQAVQMFTELITQFPMHSLVSSCHYWVGESQFNLGNYQEAISSLNQVLQAARSLKKDDALMALGKSYSQLNRKEEAREALNRLIREFPNSEFVSKAEAMLNQM